MSICYSYDEHNPEQSLVDEEKHMGGLRYNKWKKERLSQGLEITGKQQEGDTKGKEVRASDYCPLHVPHPTPHAHHSFTEIEKYPPFCHLAGQPCQCASVKHVPEETHGHC